jgi:CheY-like chemotaxis protein
MPTSLSPRLARGQQKWRPALPRRLIGDETRIRQILLNLTGNAIKFTQEGGILMRLCLDGERSPDKAAQITMEVEDTGIGMPPEALDVIFDEFAQADQTLARRFEGTGLGLAITRRLVLAMGGTIEVESEQNAGSRFRVRLELGVDAPATETQSLEGQRLVILNDRPLLTETLARMAREAKAKVNLVSNADELMELLNAEPVDIMICPIDTKDGPGAMLAQRARRDYPSLHALVLLRPQDRDRLPHLVGESTSTPFDGYLVFPVRTASFMARLAAWNSIGVANPIPVHVDEEQMSQPALAPEGLRVLVAEDNDINALLTRTLLEREHHAVRLARNGNEVLSALQDMADNLPDLVLMDIHMPGMDGFEATRHLRALPEPFASIPVIALTANAMASDKQACLDAGMDDYLSKPIEPRELTRLLAFWAGRRSEHAAPSTEPLAMPSGARANLA